MASKFYKKSNEASVRKIRLQLIIEYQRMKGRCLSTWLIHFFLLNLPNKLFYPYRFSNNCLIKYSSLTQYWFSWKCISFRGFVPNFDMPNKLFFSLVCRLSNCLTIKNSYLVQWLNIGFVATAVSSEVWFKIDSVTIYANSRHNIY